MKETELQSNVQKLIRDKGGYVVKYHGSPMSRAGVPDLLVCYLGMFCAMECKVGDNDVSPLQRKEMSDIANAGGWAVVVRSEQDARNALEALERVYVMLRGGKELPGRYGLPVSPQGQSEESA